MKNFNQLNVLYVEDNPGDIRLLQEELNENEIDLNLSIVRDGLEAINFLYQVGKYQKGPVPDLILMDINLPKWSGLEVLLVVKGDKKLRNIPVVLLTTSSSDYDIKKGEALDAFAYENKPLEAGRLIELLQETGVEVPEKVSKNS